MPRTSDATPAELETLAQLYEQGLTYDEIDARLGWHRSLTNSRMRLLWKAGRVARRQPKVEPRPARVQSQVSAARRVHRKRCLRCRDTFSTDAPRQEWLCNQCRGFVSDMAPLAEFG